jgi:hypothetical protein
MPGSRWSRYGGNRVTTFGIILALVAAAAIVFLLVLQLIEGEENPYVGILLFLVIPPFFFLGAALIPIGMLRTWRRVKRGETVEPVRWPVIDLSRKDHRGNVALGGATVVVLGALAIIGSYHGFHHTESVSFCGETCHEVMKPEHTAYANSPHARVPCAACHVGEGADWYVKSKLSGVRQVFAVMGNTFSRPIETPIQNLRPAQETCEQCHWPEKFFGAQQRQRNHYMYDEENSHWPIELLILIGGGAPESGQNSGIHWHMNINTHVEYIARDHRRHDIPWVRVTNRQTGAVTLYESEEAPLTEEEIATAEIRTMDCMDCHNRPSHVFRSPDRAVDEVMETSLIPADLPYIKSVAVEAMADDYATEQEAYHGIATTVEDFYQVEYPEIHEERIGDIHQAIATIQREFGKNLFPEMGVSWKAYPDNIGHFYFPGCMRCHSGDLVSDTGLRITRDCTSCHIILSQGTGDRAEYSISPDGLEFVHPEDIDEEWRETGCYECHEGTAP